MPREGGLWLALGLAGREGKGMYLSGIHRLVAFLLRPSAGIGLLGP